MSTTVALRFPWGRYHATPWDRNVNEGVVEWPPSPYRLLRALVAAWQERAWTLPAEAVSGLLERLMVQLPTYQLPRYRLGHTRHYYPDPQHRYGNHSTDKILDAFVVTEHDAELRITWPVDVDTRERKALETLVQVLPHLGRADSICVGRVVDDMGAGLPARPLFEGEHPPYGESTTRLLAPEQTARLSDLFARPRDVRRQRLSRPPGTRWVTYSVPGELMRTSQGPSSRRVAPTAARWVIASPGRPSAHATLAVTHVLRSACQSAYGTLFEQASSSQLSGKDEHGEPLRGHVHAHYLALDRRARHEARGDRRIEDLVVWVDETAGGFTGGVTAALGIVHLRGLRGHGDVADFRPLRLGLDAIGSIHDIAPELTRPSTLWESHTPFLPARHPKRKQELSAFVRAEVLRELDVRGFPGAVQIDLVTGDWSAYRRHRPRKEKLREVSRRPWGLRIQFGEEVTGPVCLGALSHFGMGLCVPIK